MSGEYWLQDVVKLEGATLASGGSPPQADAFTINGQPGPNYNCSQNGYKPKTSYLYIHIYIYIAAGLSNNLLFCID